MASDLGSGDVVTPVRADIGLLMGQRYTVRDVIRLPKRMSCVACGEVDDRAIHLVGVQSDELWGYCHCDLRRIGGPGVLERFLERLLRPVPVPADPVLVPEDA